MTDKKYDDSTRFKEISAVLHKNKISRGVTPEKLRIILEELGPTFVKLGQIMSLHSDILPKAYCDELMKLDSEVAPMPFAQVENILQKEYQTSWTSYFRSIDQTPIGSASIAQVHHAVLKNGSEVIIKVQREGIYDTMARDISLLHRIVRLMPSVGDFKQMIDLDMVLDELWQVAQEEMDFLKEASNMEEFRHNNKDIACIGVPETYPEYSTAHVLVMEYIGGWAINDAEHLKEAGYDLNEIGRKFVNNFIKQVMDDGFFHADPHPGNVKIRDGKIVWIDMGMMGRLSEHDRKVMVKGVKGIGLHDLNMVEEAVLEIGEFRAEPDRNQLYQDLKDFLDRYGSASMGQIDIAVAMNDLLEIMKANSISLPHGMTMLCRGLTQVEGVLADIAPDVNMYEIASGRVREESLADLDWKAELEKGSRTLYRSLQKGSELPSLTNDLLKEIMHGQLSANIDLQSTDNLAALVHSAVRNLDIGLCVAALLVSSSIICTTDMDPKILGIPMLGFIGYFSALFVSAALVIRYLYRKHKAKVKARRRKKK